MKKLLLVVLNVLLIIVLIIVMKDGIKFSDSFQILSFQGIEDLNQQLTQKIEEAENYQNNYSSACSVLNTDIASLAATKKEYLDLVTISSESEIQQATQTKTYTIEYLWGKVGNHATSEGVNIKMDITSSNAGYRNLNFTVTGNYLAMTNFIYKLENDSDLEFTIDNFDMTNQKCTFVVKDVVIKQEQMSTGVDAQTQDDVSANPNTVEVPDQSVTSTISEGTHNDADAIGSTNDALKSINI